MSNDPVVTVPGQLFDPRDRDGIIQAIEKDRQAFYERLFEKVKKAFSPTPSGTNLIQTESSCHSYCKMPLAPKVNNRINNFSIVLH